MQLNFRILPSFLFLLLASAVFAVPTFIWREAETPDAATFKVPIVQGSPEQISDGKWAMETLEQKDFAAKWGDGRTLSYKLNVQQAGAYHFWLHLGFERVRSPLQWRMDAGDWKTIAPTDRTTNLIEVGIWCEVAWYDAGALDLPAGAHTLDINFPKPEKNHLLYALDALCLVQGDWLPDGSLKPGEVPSSALDLQAAGQIYAFPVAALTALPRTSLSLNGLWQVARDDDTNMSAAPYEPLKDLPTTQLWRGVQVPGNLFSTPALSFAHRVWYRARVDVPAGMKGRSFILDFTGTNWIASVMVNGKFIDWRESTRVPWQCDITRAVTPGQVNEIIVGIKSPWYAIGEKKDSSLDDTRNMPTDFFKYMRFIAPIYPSDKGGYEGMVPGITDPVRLVVAGGPAYVADTYVKTTVTDANFKPTNKTITAEITVTNPSGADVTAQVSATAFFTGTVEKTVAEKTLAPVMATIPAGGSQVVKLSALWPDAKLWWPGDDSANMYILRTSVTINGVVVDSADQTFGFRDIKADGIYIRINGVRQNFHNLLSGFKGPDLDAALKHFRAGNNNFERFGGNCELSRYLPILDDQLSWTDQHGVPGRLSSMIDGMFITLSADNPLAWTNFREHIAQRAKAYRNHPSIIVYSLENETLAPDVVFGGYINNIAMAEAGLRSMQDAAHSNDPTRLCMIDDQGALADNSLDIANYHYAEDGFFPDNATPLHPAFNYWPNKSEPWDGKRPLAAGEIAYFSGNNADHAWIGGESAASSNADAKIAYTKYLRYIFQRYRWNDVAIICPWCDEDGFSGAINDMAPLAAFTREYSRNLFAGEEATRTVKVFNDTLKSTNLTFTWTVSINGKKVAGNSSVLTIEPGFAQEQTITFTPPKLLKRTYATLTLEVTQTGSPSFKDTQAYAVFPRVTALKLKRPVFVLEGATPLAPTLAKWGMNAKAITKWNEVSDPTGIIVVGADVLQAKQSIANLVTFAKGGGRVVMLEQNNPMQGADLPAALKQEQDKNKKPVNAFFTFGQGFGTPLFTGLEAADLSNWVGDDPTAKSVWVKPSGAARSWVGCGPGLTQSALVELPCGAGEMLASQLCVAGKLATEPAAGVLLENLLKRADSYAPPSDPVTIYAPDRPDLHDFVKGLGCKLQEAATLDDALNAKTNPILVISAAKANLDALLARKAAVDAYTQAGGWIMLWGLEPDGLDAFNTLLGTHHILREFRVESVHLIRDPLDVGLESPDVTMYSKDVIAPWSNLCRVSQDVFTYCVDGEDIAPFCFGINPNYKFLIANGPYNLVNGLTNADFWHYIDQIFYTAIPPEFELHTFKLPVACKLKTVKVWNNANYNTIQDFDLRIDGKSVAKAVLPDNYDMTEIPINGVTANTSVGLYALSVRAHQPRPIMGLDLVKFLRELPDWYQGKVFPMTDNGGLMRYPRGTGGFVLNEVKLTDANEKDNLPKKQRIASTILQNLGAMFGEPEKVTNTPADAGNPAALLDPSLWHKQQ